MPDKRTPEYKERVYLWRDAVEPLVNKLRELCVAATEPRQLGWLYQQRDYATSSEYQPRIGAQKVPAAL